MGRENSGRKSADELSKQTKRILHEAGLAGAQLIRKAISQKTELVTSKGGKVHRRKVIIPQSKIEAAEFAINHSIGKPTQRIFQVEGRMTMQEIAEKAKEFAQKSAQDSTQPTIILVPVKDEKTTKNTKN